MHATKYQDMHNSMCDGELFDANLALDCPPEVLCMGDRPDELRALNYHLFELASLKQVTREPIVHYSNERERIRMGSGLTGEQQVSGNLRKLLYSMFAFLTQTPLKLLWQIKASLKTLFDHDKAKLLKNIDSRVKESII